MKCGRMHVAQGFFMNAAWAGLIAAGGGCVTLGAHEELQRQHVEVTERLSATHADVQARAQEVSEAKTTIAGLEAAVVSEREKGEALTQARDAVAAELVLTRQELERTQGELSQVLKDRSALKGSVETMRTALDELARRKSEAESRMADYKALLARFRSLIDAGKLKVAIVDGRMVVALASDILFPSGSAALSKEGKASLVEIAAILAAMPERKFQVEGHTDNVPIATATFPSNWELASARALTVVKAMIEDGMPAHRVSAASFGETKPVASNDTPEGRAVNRRIDIVVVPDLSALPGFEELKQVGG